MSDSESSKTPQQGEHVKEVTENHRQMLDPELDEQLKGAKLVFGDKLVDPNDRRVRYPHHRVIDDAPNTTAGGLLQTGGHRPQPNK